MRPSDDASLLPLMGSRALGAARPTAGRRAVEVAVFFACTVVGAWWSRWLTADIGEFSTIWPPAGLAVAAVVCRPVCLVGVAAGVFVWSTGLQGHSPGFALAFLLTLGGAVFYGFSRPPEVLSDPNASRLRVIVTNYAVLFSKAILPAALIGTLLYVGVDPVDRFADTLIGYLIAESAGIAVFAPPAAMILRAGRPLPRFRDPRRASNLALVAAVIALPVAFHLAGQQVYAQGLTLAFFPLVAWIAVQNEKDLMALTILLIGISQLMFKAAGVGMSAATGIFDFVEPVLWVLAAFVIGDALLAYSLEREDALARARWRASHDENTQWLNERGLQEELARMDPDGSDLVLTQVCQRDMLMASLSYDELRAIERRLCSALAGLHDWRAASRLSDLTLAFVVARGQPLPLGEPRFQTVRIDDMDIRLSLAWGRIPLQRSEPKGTLAEGYAALQRAMAEPMIRSYTKSPGDEPIAERLSYFSSYQEVMEALDGGRLELYGQRIEPAVPGAGSVELLSRLSSPSGEALSPGGFLAALRAFDATENLDRCVITEAIAPGGALERLLARFDRVNINVSGSTLCDPGFTEWLRSIWPDSLPTERVCLEFTETELIRSWRQAIDTAGELRAMGFRIGVDDFGSGLASYEYLEHFRLDLIKLDGQFVRDVADNPVHLAMVRATVRVARSLGVAVCVEFVDDERSRRLLIDEGVDYLQGFHIGRPQPINELLGG